jgi:hypothetical protein
MPTKPIQMPDKQCERCGKSFTRNRYNGVLEDTARFRARRFCSLRCANSRGLWGKSKTAHRRIAHLAVNERCANCGKRSPSQKMHVHHKNRNWSDNNPSNLTTLCPKCHGAEHKKPPTPCEVCGRPSRRNQMCQTHWQRFKKYGDPFLTKVRRTDPPHDYVLVRVYSPHFVDSRYARKRRDA